MRAVTLIGLVLAGLMAAAMPGAAAPAQAPAAANPPPASKPPAASEAAARTAAPQAPRDAARSGERRRRSYASCNRESHKRNLRGGARRRFLIRCKLGYERRHIIPRPAPTQPSTPPKRP